MEYTTLGATGLKVSVAGLGCGGPSRLGLRQNADGESHAIALVRQAIEMGVNFLDTAEAYGTEAIVGRAISVFPRKQLVISTKKTLPPANHPNPEGEIKGGLEQSLKRLGTDYIDVYHLHGVEPKDYGFAVERLLPPMQELKAQGKIRFVGVTEGFLSDPAHEMLQRSLKEDRWDVVMVGFSLLNPSARKTVLPMAGKNHVGVLNMFAVRRALSQPARLKQLCDELVQKGRVAPGELNPDDPLDFVLNAGGASSLPEAAYRFCRHEPGVDVVLTGTGNLDHLKCNIEAILKPALAKSVLDRLNDIFGKLDMLTGN